jgi:hypothetical protein
MSVHGLESKKGVCYSEYDFAKDGGAISAIALRGNVLPAGAVVTGGIVDVETAITSAGLATLALHLSAAGDILSACDKGNFPADGQLLLGMWGPMVKPVGPFTTAKTPTLTIAAFTVTAGKFTVALEYMIVR